MSWISSETSAVEPNVGFDGAALAPRSTARIQTIVRRITTLLASAVGDEAASAMCGLGSVRKIAVGTSIGWRPTAWPVYAGRERYLGTVARRDRGPPTSGNSASRRTD